MTAYLVREIVRRNIPVLSPDTPIRQAAFALVDAKADAAPVVDDDGVLVGILSQRDCFRPALHASYHRQWTGRVMDQMSRDVVSIEVEEEIIRAAEMFLMHPHRVFPVLNSNQIEGLLYRSEVLRFLIHFG
ncbi:CBS domain-containing protein [Jannaschia pohangensis]|uniref:CBS domain-containing protein n=1 Tax=Jannaschia pohangensis TaxID=390807 RepID=A0A1I3H706_9RHOB|nr:CBS domain-containing protein [Jannaschia pohangensis]SFI31451.1 CBS domain-containing protein [Jannaschia pohangensis]